MPTEKERVEEQQRLLELFKKKGYLGSEDQTALEKLTARDSRLLKFVVETSAKKIKPIVAGLVNLLNKTGHLRDYELKELESLAGTESETFKIAKKRSVEYLKHRPRRFGFFSRIIRRRV